MKPHRHTPVQHRDGKPPWCDECGKTAAWKEPESIFDKSKGTEEMQTVTYSRKPFFVEAIQVTATNIPEVAAWCEGELLAEGKPPAQYIRVDVQRVMNDRQTKAYIGDWVLFANNSFKVYTDKAFKKSFELVPVVEITPTEAEAELESATSATE